MAELCERVVLVEHGVCILITNLTKYDQQTQKQLRSINSKAVVPEQEPKCRPGAAGQVDMPSRSQTCRNVVPEQQDKSKCRPEQLDMSNCRPRAAGQVEMLSKSSWTGRNVVPDQQDRSKCRPRTA